MSVFASGLCRKHFRSDCQQRFNFTNISVAFVTAGRDYFYLTTIRRYHKNRYIIFNFTTFPRVTPVFRMYSQIIIDSQIQSAVTTKSSAPVIFSPNADSRPGCVSESSLPVGCTVTSLPVSLKKKRNKIHHESRRKV